MNLLFVTFYLAVEDLRASYLRSPVHPFPSLLPSPMKPNGHWQMKLPSVFEQVASLTHLSGSDEHSSISGGF